MAPDIVIIVGLTLTCPQSQIVYVCHCV